MQTARNDTDCCKVTIKAIVNEFKVFSHFVIAGHYNWHTYKTSCKPQTAGGRGGGGGGGVREKTNPKQTISVELIKHTASSPHGQLEIFLHFHLEIFLHFSNVISFYAFLVASG